MDEKKEKKDSKKNKDPIATLSNVAFVSAIIGVCTVGICPAFGIIGITVPAVMSAKGAKISDEIKRKNKKAAIAGAISICMFFIDLALVIAFKDRF